MAVRHSERMTDDEGSKDPGWTRLESAGPLLIQGLRNRHINRIEFVAAFPHFEAFAVWLCTQTDADRDVIGTHDPLVDEVRSVLLEVGFRTDQLAGLRTTAQSQETIDRDFAGSWFYATR